MQGMNAHTPNMAKSLSVQSSGVVLIWWESHHHFDKPLEVGRSHLVEQQVYASGCRAVHSCVCVHTPPTLSQWSDTAVFSTMLPRVKHKYVINCLFKTTPCLSASFVQNGACA